MALPRTFADAIYAGSALSAAAIVVTVAAVTAAAAIFWTVGVLR